MRGIIWGTGFGGWFWIDLGSYAWICVYQCGCGHDNSMLMILKMRKLIE